MDQNRQPLLVRYIWQNYSGIRCAKMIPFATYNNSSEVCPKLLEDGLFYPLCQDAIPNEFNIPTNGRDLLISPLRNTFKTIPWNKEQAFVFCKFLEPNGSPYSFCPVHLLEKAMSSLKEEGYEVKCGFEIKFQICKKRVSEEDDIVFAENNKFVSSNSLEMFSDIIEIIYKHLLELGVTIEHIHKEGPLGQFEIVIRYDEVVKSLQNYHITREVISTVLSKQGYEACFVPKTPVESGNGVHCHMSIWKDGHNALGSLERMYGLSEVGESFMAGIYSSYRALLHFLAPSPNSLKRIMPQKCVGSYKCWGVENRDAPIRLIHPYNSANGVTHFEIKSMDHTANHFLALALIINAGTQGIRTMAALPIPHNSDPHQLTSSSREELGISQLPYTFEQRKNAIFSEEGLSIRNFLGEEFVKNLLVLNETDMKAFEHKTLEEEMKTLIRML